MKKIIFLIIIFSFAAVKAQIVNDYVKKIDLKLSKDKNYLNLNYLSFNPSDGIDTMLFTIPRDLDRKPAVLKTGEEYVYRLVYLKEGIRIDSLQLLYLEEIKLNSVAGDKLFGAVNNVSDDTVKVLNFRDMYYLKRRQPVYYARLKGMVERNLIENEGSPAPSILRINPDENLKTEMGFSSRDNKDYLMFENVNGKHWFPKKNESRSVGRRREAVDEGFRFDASFSTLSISHSVMDFNAGSSSLEFTTEDKVMNILPWQSQTLAGGFRALISFGDNKSDIYNVSYIDAKIMARIKMSSKNFFDKVPFASSAVSLINFGNAITGELHFTRPFTLPFINLYFSTAKQAFDNPAFIIEEPGNRRAYFSFSQVESTMSFYWNTNADLENRFRMDIGMAFYDIWKASLNDENSLIKKEMIQNKYYPTMSLYYSFIPDNRPLFGIKTKYLDNTISGQFWMKIIEFDQVGSFRFEVYFVTPVFLREKNEWESDGGTLFQLRYRYGL